MRSDERAKLVEELQAAETAIMVGKGEEYSRGQEDVNDNFKTVGSLLADAPVDDLTVAGVYLLKHILSLCDYIVKRRTPPSGEGIEGRIADARNYLAIVYSIIKEQEGQVR